MPVHRPCSSPTRLVPRTVSGTVLVLLVLLTAGLLPATAPATLAQSPAPAAPERLEGLPFVLPSFLSSGRANVEVNLMGFVLGFLKEASRESDSELAHLLQGLESVQLRIAEATDESPLPANARREMLALSRILESEGWQATVRVRDEEESIFIYLQGEGHLATGVVALFVSDSEAGLIHIRGELDARDLGRLAAGLDLSALEEVVKRTNGRSGGSPETETTKPAEPQRDVDPDGEEAP